ncbi:MAG TPA: maleylpyruvate isomerase family mycothiol-dependent enzyme [Acidimicrobiia bacterium]|jgi:uncharacterized protein (TIGR03083 family)
MSPASDKTAIEELLGAYALDAIDPDEIVEIEAALARDPELAREAARLVRTAAWLGASEAIAAPATMRADVLARARARRSAATDAAASTYLASTERLAQTFATLTPDEYDEITPNGLDARELVVHLAAQESLLAQAVDRAVVTEIDDTDIDARTSAFIERYRDATLDDVVRIWRSAVDEVAAWAVDPATQDVTVPWIGLDMPRDNFLVARAFENWIHRDDLRGVQGLDREPPAAAELHEMAELSMRTLPFALLVAERAHPGKVARIVLTGPGGGEWTCSMGGRRPPTGAVPDVTVTAGVVDWCLVAGERLQPGELPCDVEGDAALAGDLVAAAPAFATL